jgi:GntR family transcriptional regulator
MSATTAARSRVAAPEAPKFVAGATALYAQLASVLRSRIRGGDWKPGEDIPSIDELCKHYGLGRITVRQALMILADEGLISSHRGRRTFVTWSPPGDESLPLFPSVTAIEHDVEHYSIEVVERIRVKQPPSRFARWGEFRGPYMRLRKVEFEGERPYGFSDLYIPEELYRRFPKGAENRAKLVRLVLQYARPPVTGARERITVAAADFEEASRLSYPMSAPVARVERVFADRDRRIVYCGQTVYRGDLFAVERDLAAFLKPGPKP